MSSPPPAPPPGWYPDPAGSGAQRYFDGTNWGPLAPVSNPPQDTPPAPRKRTSTPQKIAAVVGAVILLFVVGKACGSGDKKDTGTSPQSTSPSTSPSSSTVKAAPVLSAADQRYLHYLDVDELNCWQGSFDCPNGPADMIGLGHAICDELDKGTSVDAIAEHITEKKPGFTKAGALILDAQMAYCS